MNKHIKSGAEIVIESLRKEGVETIFGYPGGVTLPLYDKLYSVNDIQHILVRHEQGATHMAEGYAKATGKPGVVLVTSGPGATNTITGITDAFMDSIPMVVLTGQVPTKAIGKDAFQEADVIGITRPITKWNVLVRDVNDLASSIQKAFEIATTGRPGPVLVDIPKDVFLAETDFVYPEKAEKEYETNIDFESVQKVAEALKHAKRPLFYVGGGTIFSGAEKELRTFAKQLNIPVTSTLHGLGAYPGSDAQFLGMLGMHGTYVANRAVDECDCLIAIGARFDDRVVGNVSEFSKHSFKAQIDIDPSNINKDVVVDVALVGDVKEVLNKLSSFFTEELSLTEWWAQLNVWEAACPMLPPPESEGFRSQHVLKALDKHLNGEGILVSDVGQNQMFSAQHLTYNHSRSHITSGGLGTMGFSVPAAIGAAFGSERKVVSVSGDGGFQMNMQELVLAAIHKLPITFIILNNSNLGMVRQWQDMFYEERYSFTNLEGKNPDFVKLAEAMGIEAKRVTCFGETDEALLWSLNAEYPTLIEFQVEHAEHVFPMIPSGGSVKDMITQRFEEEK